MTFYVYKKPFYLNSFNDNFHGAGESTTDLTVAGGVAVLWYKKMLAAICGEWDKWVQQLPFLYNPGLHVTG